MKNINLVLVVALLTTFGCVPAGRYGNLRDASQQNVNERDSYKSDNIQLSIANRELEARIAAMEGEYSGIRNDYQAVQAELDRAREAAQKSGSPFKVLDERMETSTGNLSVSTMHLAKGLEFRAVAVMACDDEVIPLQERIESVADDADLQEVYDTERHLLYVACTRARDHLLITSVDPASEFLDDLRG